MYHKYCVARTKECVGRDRRKKKIRFEKDKTAKTSKYNGARRTCNGQPSEIFRKHAKNCITSHSSLSLKHYLSVRSKASFLNVQCIRTRRGLYSNAVATRESGIWATRRSARERASERMGFRGDARHWSTRTDGDGK